MSIKTMIQCISHCVLLCVLLSGLANANTPKTANPRPLLNIQHWSSSQGVKIYFVHTSGLPILDINVMLDAGASHDQDRPGLAHLTGVMLMTGTQTLNANQIAQRFDDTGANYGVIISHDMTSVAVRTLTKPNLLTSVLNTLHAVLTQPTFPSDEFVRLKNQALQTIKLQNQQPSIVAQKAFFKLVYKGQPYQYPVIGTKHSIETLTRADLKQFYERFYQARHTKIVLVGNISRQKAESIVNQLTRGLPQGQSTLPLSTQHPPTHNTVTSKTQTIDFPSQQTQILIGQIGIDWQSPDYFALRVGNYALGGSPLTSRLFYAVRNQRGLAYSVYSMFYRMRQKGPFLISLQTRHKQSNEAIRQVHQTLRLFLEKGITSKELTEAKDNINGRFLMALANNAAITNTVSTIAYYNLPLNYLDTFRDNIRQVTRAQIQTAFRRHVNPDRLYTVLVGQPN